MSRYPPRRISLLVRNLPMGARPEELRSMFERYGEVRDVYLPRDFYTDRPRGFGFVEFLDGRDAEEAMYHLDGTSYGGREISVVLSKESRKTPSEMYSKEKHRIDGRRHHRSPRRRSYSRSPSPYRRRYHRSRSISGGRYSRRYERRSRTHSRTPPRRYGRYSRSPPRHRHEDSPRSERKRHRSREDRHRDSPEHSKRTTDSKSPASDERRSSRTSSHPRFGSRSGSEEDKDTKRREVEEKKNEQTAGEKAASVSPRNNGNELFHPTASPSGRDY